MSLLHLAAIYDLPIMAEICLLRDFDIGHPDNVEFAPLHMAVAEEKVSVARILLCRAAAVNLKTADNRTPLDLSIMCGRPELMEILLSYGAEFNDSDTLFQSIGQQEDMFDLNDEFWIDKP